MENSSFSYLKLCLRRGLSSEDRKYWWPVMMPFDFPDDIVNDRKAAYNEMSATATRLISLIGGTPLDNLKDLLRKNKSVNINHPSLDILISIISGVIDSIHIQFFMISHILSEIQTKYFGINPMTIATPAYVFKKLLWEFMPSTFKSLESIDGLSDKHLYEIFKNLFVHIFPHDLVLIIMDPFFFEGEKILFRYGLALIRLFKHEIKRGDFETGNEFWLRVKTGMNDAENKAKLQEYAFEGANIFSKVRGRYMKIGKSVINALEVASREDSAATRESSVVVSTTGISSKSPFENSSSSILDEKMKDSLAVMLPELSNFRNFEVVYSTLLHGTSLETLYRKTRGLSPCILIIQALNFKAVFGAYLSCAMSPPSKSPKGDAQTFCFRIDGNHRDKHPSAILSDLSHADHDEDSTTTDISRAAILQQYCVCANDYISFGGSLQHMTNAIRITDDLNACTTGPSDTYGNAGSLVLETEEKEHTFQIGLLEVLCPN